MGKVSRVTTVKPHVQCSNVHTAERVKLSVRWTRSCVRMYQRCTNSVIRTKSNYYELSSLLGLSSTHTINISTQETNMHVGNFHHSPPPHCEYVLHRSHTFFGARNGSSNSSESSPHCIVSPSTLLPWISRVLQKIVHTHRVYCLPRVMKSQTLNCWFRIPRN